MFFHSGFDAVDLQTNKYKGVVLEVAVMLRKEQLGGKWILDSYKLNLSKKKQYNLHCSTYEILHFYSILINQASLYHHMYILNYKYKLGTKE